MEYDLTNPASWIVYPAPPVDPSFDQALLAIGGTNPHGEPMLRKVWGATHRAKGELVYQIYESEPEFAWHEFTDPETKETRRVKTTQEIPAGVLISVPIYESIKLGELRWIIERWVSPDDLAKMGYFDPQLRNNVVDAPPTLTAEARAEFWAMLRAGEKPEIALARVENQLDRARPLEIDQELATYFDPDWRSRGDYQFFFRLQRKNDLYHPADGEALEAIRMIWHYNQTVDPAEHEANLEAAFAKGDIARDQRLDALWVPDNVLQYADPDGAKHTLWQGPDGSGNARIDLTL